MRDTEKAEGTMAHTASAPNLHLSEHIEGCLYRSTQPSNPITDGAMSKPWEVCAYGAVSQEESLTI